MFLARCVFIVLCALAAFAAPAQAQADPLARYGEQIRFEIHRKGKSVGWHTVSFERAGDALRTRSTVHIAVDFLFFTAFRYRYESDATWRQGQFERAEVKIEDNGKPLLLRVMREGERALVSGTSGAFSMDASTHMTEHWNAAVLDQRQVLNTLTGKLNEVDIQRGRRELVDTERGPVPASVYHYTGDLKIDVWYDDEGRWVKMRFKGRDGSPIEYVCRRCQGPGNLS